MRSVGQTLGKESAEHVTTAGGRQQALIQLANEAAQLNVDLAVAQERVRHLASVEEIRLLTHEEKAEACQVRFESKLTQLRLQVLRRELEELTGAGARGRASMSVAS